MMDLQTMREKNDKRVAQYNAKIEKIKAQAIQEYINSQREIPPIMCIMKK